MNHEIAKEWKNALRSENYHQGHNQLKTEGGAEGVDRFCCLGVLCDLSVKWGVGHWDGNWFVTPSTSKAINNEDTGLYTLPIEVKNWAGMGTSVGVMKNGDILGLEGEAGEISLASLNDTGASFSAISQIISLHEEDL